jgi:DNA repair photolyase
LWHTHKRCKDVCAYCVADFTPFRSNKKKKIVVKEDFSLNFTSLPVAKLGMRAIIT